MTTNLMNFGAAVVALQAGELVAREGWNGKGMYLFLVIDWDVELAPALRRIEARDDCGLDFAPFIAMRTADGKIVPWLASQTDILATDWNLV